MLRSENSKSAIHNQPASALSAPYGSPGKGHEVNHTPNSSEAYDYAEYYSDVPNDLNNGNGHVGGDQYEHYDFAQETIRSNAELLSTVPDINATPIVTKGKGGNSDQRYEAMTIDSKHSHGSVGDIYDTVASENYEVDRTLTGEEDHSYDDASLDGSHGYAYAVVEVRLYGLSCMAGRKETTTYFILKSRCLMIQMVIFVHALSKR